MALEASLGQKRGDVLRIASTYGAQGGFRYMPVSLDWAP
jgi:hypothetical protein